MTAPSLSLKQMRAANRAHARARPRLLRRAFAVFVTLEALMLLAMAMLFTGAASADERVRGEVRVFTDNGYARLVFRLDEEVPADVRIANSVMVITFKKPVAVSVDRVNVNARDYISAARIDPDGSAIRIALAREVKFNTIPAAERLYVDLLPLTWKSMLPGLPQEVIDELSRRTREAERQLHRQRLTAKQKQPPLVRVRVAIQPTFIRYVFEMPDTANVVPERSEGRLTLNFDEQIRWDLADVKATLPSTLESVDAETEFDSVAVHFVLNGKPEVRTFREDRSIVVDVGRDNAKPKPAAAAGIGAAPSAAGEALKIAPPDTVPADGVAKDAPQLIDAPPAAAAAPPSPAPKVADKTPAPAPAPESIEPPAPAQPAATAAPATAPPVPKEATKLAPAPVPARKAANPNAPVLVDLRESSEGLRLDFPFAAPTPAAVFRRGDVLWLVFDSASKIDLAALAGNAAIRSAKSERGADGATIVWLRLARPQVVNLDADGPGWAVTIGGTAGGPTRPLAIARTIVGKNRASLAIPFEKPSAIHRLVDPDVGDRLMVVTALAPARGFLKPQDFVELRALNSAHGIVVQPVADDVTAELSADKVMISRPGGLSLSSSSQGDRPQMTSNYRVLTFDTQLWGFDRQAPFVMRQSELLGLAAAAPEVKRRQARINLARFYLARDMAAEAKAVLDVALADQRGAEDVTGSVLKAVANVMLDRPEDALKDLSNPAIGNQQDAPIWRAVALSRQGRWNEARDGFKGADATMASLPIELQRLAMQEQLRSAIEVRDYAGATRVVNELETIGVPPDLQPSIDVLTGRLYEGLGRNGGALTSYRAAAGSRDRRAAAQGRLRELELAFGAGDVPRKQMVGDLETLTAVWRGDDTEVEGLKLLAHLYTVDGRYRDAFHVMRTALRAHPSSELTRKIQDEAATTFDSLFLAGKGDALPPVEALGLFYDYRELTPIGRRGDEMIRRLADRLVAVDLLDQAAELLQHQVDHRLQGAGRAQVATRLAVIYLMNRKPERAFSTLQSSRTADLSNELRDQRLLLEARALSDIGRHDVALELIDNIKGREADRLRADILWSARRWRLAAERIELLYATRWREFSPLNETERDDILRAAIGYALADEPLSLARLRDKYAAKMADGPDRRAFDVVSAPIGTGGPEFQDVARKVAGIDTLDSFLRDMRARYPDSVAAPGVAANAGAPSPPPPPPPPQPAAVPKPDAADKAVQNVPGNAAPGASPLPPTVPAGVPLRPDMAPTGSILPRAAIPRTAR